MKHMRFAIFAASVLFAACATVQTATPQAVTSTSTPEVVLVTATPWLVTATPEPASTATITSTPTNTPTQQPTVTPHPPALRDLADKRGIKIGTQVIWEGLVDPRVSEPYKRIAADEFNELVISGELSWGGTLTPGKAVHPERNRFDFSKADLLVKFAAQNNMAVTAHELIWGLYYNLKATPLPDWLINGNFSRDELITIMREHIQAVMSHYKGRIQAYVVVNEPYPYGAAVDFWYDKLGADYIDIAFQTARETDPSAILILNDCCGNEVAGQWADFDYQTTKRLKSKGLIDAVGFQMHLDGAKPPNQADVIANMKRFGELGVAIYVTEFDVDLTDVQGTQAERYQRQAQIYKDMLRACLESAVCKSFSMFGFTDSISWYKFGGKPNANALPIDENYNPKPAYFALRDVLLGE
jgi:endo-1,4-beta-xylanase